MNRNAKWAEVKVGDLGQVFTGRTPSTKYPEYFGDEFFFITPGDMHQGKHINATARGLSQAGANLLRRIQLPPKSICVSCIGWQMGETVMTTALSYTNQQINSIVPNGDVDADFIYYSFVPRKQELLSLASATGVRTPILNKSAFCDLRLSLPPHPTQRKIAAILSAYDDLIENNTLRIKILEEMAQALYREWFVHFRFPGHEKVRMVDSPLGRIPEGWEEKRVSDAITINPKMKVPKEGIKPFIAMDSLSTNSMIIDSFNHKTGNSGSKFKNKDTLFARITPCLENGKTGFVQILPSDDVAIGSTEFIVLRSKTLIPEFVYLIARSKPFRDHAIKSMSGATGRQRVHEKCFDNFLIAQPDNKILENFQVIIFPIFINIHLLSCKNANLCRTRDLLLPKLISGDLDISKLEITERRCET